MDPRAGLDDVEKRKFFLTLPGFQLRPLGRPARSQSLYRLCYPGSKYISKKNGENSNRYINYTYTKSGVRAGQVT
jgi:hypothetical protein